MNLRLRVAVRRELARAVALRVLLARRGPLHRWPSRARAANRVALGAPEVAGSAQLGSLNNQGYAGPGSGARQYDFVLWALDVAKLPDTSGMTTAQIRMEILPMHELATTEPILVRNTV